MRFRAVLLAAAFSCVTTAASASTIGVLGWTDDAGVSGAGSTFTVENISGEIFESVVIDLLLGPNQVRSLTSLGDIGASPYLPQTSDDLSSLLIPLGFNRVMVRLTLNGQDLSFGFFDEKDLQPDSLSGPDVRIGYFNLDLDPGTPTAVPEPATVSLLAAGMVAGLCHLRRRRVKVMSSTKGREK